MSELMTRLYVEFFFFFFFFLYMCVHTDCESRTHALRQLEKTGTQRQLQQIQGVMQYCDQYDTYYHDCDVIGACMMQIHAFFILECFVYVGHGIGLHGRFLVITCHKYGPELQDS